MRFNLDGLEVFFPYDYVYKEQYQYMLELKRALDAKGDAILEMPTGTGKTVSLLSLITSYQYAHPDCGKLIYCTRTVPEMIKAMDELKRVVAYRSKELNKEGGDLLAVCLSSRRNMCVHPDVADEGDRERVDAMCRSMTASWVRQKAETDPAVKTCNFFEGYDKEGSDAEIRGIYNLDDLKALGVQKGWCPYFLARHVISYANVVVYNYQYMLDPKISALISKELEDKSIVVFDEAHNIDNVAIEALSVSLDRRTLEAAGRNLDNLRNEVKKLKEADASRLQEEYQRLVAGLAGGAGAGAGAAPAALGAGDAGVGGMELPGAPVLPADIVQEAVPGNIRNADLFVQFMRHVVRYLRERIKVAVVETVNPASFLSKMGQELGIDTRPLRFAYTRLNSLLRTLQVTDVGDFTPLQLVSDFATLVATYPTGFAVILEPYNSKTPHIPDPLLQLACLDASLAVKPVFAKYASVILTSGTLSPLDMYPKMLAFNPVVRVSLEMSIDRPCIAPMVVARGPDQLPVTTKFEARDDVNVVRNYGALLVQLAATVPDGLVAFFPSYSYMEMIVAAWHGMGVLAQVESHKLLFIETKDIVETTLALNNYKKACDCGRGAVFLSIARGKVAEGIDFDRHYGRAVVLFGIPFQYTRSVVLRARLQYLHDTFHIREQDFLTFDAMRQAAQCVGRIIRSKKDYGVIVFADKRYGSADKRSKLPHWVLQFLPDSHLALSTDMAVETARRFLREMAQPPSSTAVKGHALLSAADIREMQAETGMATAQPRPLPPMGYPGAIPGLPLPGGGAVALQLPSMIGPARAAVPGLVTNSVDAPSAGLGQGASSGPGAASGRAPGPSYPTEEDADIEGAVAAAMELEQGERPDDHEDGEGGAGAGAGSSSVVVAAGFAVGPSAASAAASYGSSSAPQAKRARTAADGKG